MTLADPKTCFAITPIGSPGTETRKKADQVFKHIISKAVAPLGYKAVRADQIHEPGIITSQVIREIVNAPLAIADLSEKNPNVFYEVAVRHVTRKPLIMLITRGEPIPFDVSANRVIQYDLADLDTVESAKEEIRRQIESFPSGNASPDNPISAAVEIQLLRQSGNPEQESLADMREAILEIRAQVSNLARSDARRATHEIRDSEVRQFRVRDSLENELRRLVEQAMTLTDRVGSIDRIIQAPDNGTHRPGEIQRLRAEQAKLVRLLSETNAKIETIRHNLSMVEADT